MTVIKELTERNDFHIEQDLRFKELSSFFHREDCATKLATLPQLLSYQQVQRLQIYQENPGK